MSFIKIGSGIKLLEELNFQYDMELVSSDKMNLVDISIPALIDTDLALWFDSTNTNSYNSTTNTFTSLVKWNKTTTSGFTINDVGLTLIDYGQKNNLSGESTTFVTNQPFTLLPISGQTGIYQYFNESDSSGNYVNLKGGYYQNYYRLYGFPYEQLPIRTENGWTLEFWVKFDELVTPPLYWGDEVESFDLFTTGNTDLTTIQLLSSGTRKRPTAINYTMEDPEIFWNDNTTFFDHEFEPNIDNNLGFIFYMGIRAEDKFYNFFSGETGLTTTTGVQLTGTFPASGVTVTGITGITALTSGTTSMVSLNQINRITGITDNAFGIRIDNEGRLGYRIVSAYTPCYIDYSIPFIKENYTNRPIFTGDTNSKWVHIAVKFKSYQKRVLVSYDNYCDNKSDIEPHIGYLEFFVNGRPVLREENYQDIIFTHLNTDKTKQEGLPFSLSWGGGSQGLYETQTFHGPDESDKRLMIQRWFNGSFNGGISVFRYYLRPLTAADIINNFNYEKSRFSRIENFGGRLVYLSDKFLTSFDIDSGFCNNYKYDVNGYVLNGYYNEECK